MTGFKHKTILVTGGAGGIGYLLGKKTLERGAAHLIIWDIDPEALSFAAERLRKEGFSVSTRQVDVSDPEMVIEAAMAVLSDHPQVDMLFNNAGIVVGKPFHKQSHHDITRTISVNTLGLMYVANAFLPAMMESGSGHIINITSAVGLTPNPGMTVYAASKWAAVGWAESLRIEVTRTHPGIKFLNVMPGYIDTGMFDGVKSPLFMPLLKPDAITNKIIRYVEREKIQLKAPFLVKLTLLFRGLLPVRVYDWIAGNIFRVYSSMDGFRGR